MKLGNAWGSFFLVGAAVAAGCATSPPYDASLGDDAGSGDDAASTLDANSHHDSASPQDSGTLGFDSSQPGMDASPGLDAASQPDSTSSMDASMQPDTSTTPDASTRPDASTTPDSSTTGCTPQNVSGFSPTWVPPTPATAACAAGDATAIYNACLGSSGSSTACSAARSTYASCYACIFTNDTASAWGPVIIESNGTVRVNEGGCVYLADSSQSTCAHSLESSNGCDDAACKAVCNVTSDPATFTAYQNCVTAAESGGCSSYATQANSCAQNISIVSNAYNCVHGADFQTLYNQIVPVFCGP